MNPLNNPDAAVKDFLIALFQGLLFTMDWKPEHTKPPGREEDE